MEGIFIQLTQKTNDNKRKKVWCNVQRIDFFADKRVVFSNRAIDVEESESEIKNLIKGEEYDIR